MWPHLAAVHAPKARATTAHCDSVKLPKRACVVHALGLLAAACRPLDPQAPCQPLQVVRTPPVMRLYVSNAVVLEGNAKPPGCHTTSCALFDNTSESPEPGACCSCCCCCCACCSLPSGLPCTLCSNKYSASHRNAEKGRQSGGLKGPSSQALPFASCKWCASGLQ